MGFSALGCLGKSTKKSEPPKLTYCPGISSVENLGFSMNIKWTQPSIPISGYRIYQQTSQGALISIATVEKNILNFVHSNLQGGQIFSYIVRCIDQNGLEDDNTVTKHGLSYPGIAYVSLAEDRKAKIFFSSLDPTNLNQIFNGSFDELRIYDEVKGVKKLLAKVPTGSLYFTVSNLKTGANHKFYVNAYNSAYDLEDGNNYFIQARVPSLSFDGLNPGFKNILALRAFGDSPGAPKDIPNASISETEILMDPSNPKTKKVPKERQIILTWASFKNAPENSSYALVRTPSNEILDTTTQEKCTMESNKSCLVCTKTGNGPHTCYDTEIALAPKKYDYTLALKLTEGSESWVEELPNPSESHQFRIRVAVPPDNMVLVQRDAVNYEICDLIGKPSDPLNHNRCEFSGWGNVPKNPGGVDIQLADFTPDADGRSYFDFGYNLFFDRFEMGCNWDHATAKGGTGMCGPGGTSGDCFLPTEGSEKVGSEMRPISTLGINGNIAYINRGYSDVNETSANYFSANGNCYQKIGGVWKSFSELSSGTSNDKLLAAQMITNNPESKSKKIPTFTAPSRKSIYDVCSLQSPTANKIVISDYGKRRLPRLREMRAAMAFPRFDGEPFADKSSTELALLQLGVNGHYLGHRACNGYWNGKASNIGFNQDGTVFDTSGVFTPSQTQNIIISASWDDILKPESDSLAYLKNGVSQITRSSSCSTSNCPLRGRGGFFIASRASQDCVTRYGIQDLMGNAEEIVSEVYTYTSTYPTPANPGVDNQTVLEFDGNDLDIKNTDMLGFKFDGIISVGGPQFKRFLYSTASYYGMTIQDDVYAPASWSPLPIFSYSGGGASVASSTLNSFPPYFSLIFGFPLISNTKGGDISSWDIYSSRQYIQANATTSLYNTKIGNYIFKHKNYGVVGPISIGGDFISKGSGRFSTMINPYGDGGGFRCVIPFN